MPTNEEFSAVYCGGDMSKERGQGRQGVAGEYQAQEWTGAPATPAVPENSYPNVFNYGYDPDNRMFSSKMSGDPVDLMESTRERIDSHADMNAAQGLMQPVATLGSHPWLRDELANPTEREAGNAEPFSDIKIPKRR